MGTFYEFFASGGMSRAGLGPSWECLFANDFAAKKAASYALNRGVDHLSIGDVAPVSTADLAGRVDLAWRPSLARTFARRGWCRPQGRTFRNVLTVFGS